jgi:hypothetical protein
VFEKSKRKEKMNPLENLGKFQLIFSDEKKWYADENDNIKKFWIWEYCFRTISSSLDVTAFRGGIISMGQDAKQLANANFKSFPDCNSEFWM